MEVIYINNSNRETFLSSSDPCVIALGFFDGVHLGHQEVINKAKKVAHEKNLTLACMSFFPHPKEILQKGEKKVQYLMPLTEKQKTLQKMGVEKFYIVQFDPEFASLTPKQFVQSYLLDFGVKYAVAGFDYTYGCFGEGHMDRMKDDSNNKIEVIKVEKVDFGGEKISSTLIRKLISSGKVDRIHRYLGEHYQVEGKVLLSENNIEAIVQPYYLLPPPGVYEAIVTNENNAWKQVVLVTRDPVKLIFSNINNNILKDNQYVHVKWVKRLPPGMFTPLEQLFFISEGII